MKKSLEQFDIFATKFANYLNTYVPLLENCKTWEEYINTNKFHKFEEPINIENIGDVTSFIFEDFITMQIIERYLERSDDEILELLLDFFIDSDTSVEFGIVKSIYEESNKEKRAKFKQFLECLYKCLSIIYDS